MRLAVFAVCGRAAAASKAYRECAIFNVSRDTAYRVISETTAYDATQLTCAKSWRPAA